MEEQRIIPLCSVNQPLHRPNDVFSRRYRLGIVRIISEHDDIRRVIPEALCGEVHQHPYWLHVEEHGLREEGLTADEGSDVLGIVDASSELVVGAVVVDPNLKTPIQQLSPIRNIEEVDRTD